MSQATPRTMYEYYGKQSVLPTHAAFKSREQLAAYEQMRRNIFVHKLSLPPQLFKGASLLEFGPDSGENSLVFAGWGANCTLSEPNKLAHPFIRQYFDRFDLSSRLVELRESSVLDFERIYTGETYDLIDAEGFIYTVKPDEQWMAVFSRLLSPDGFLIVSYLESFGCFLEFFLKVLHTRVRHLTGGNSLAVAEQLFTTKWNSIPHTRSIASWTMDVLDNPFVRLSYVLESKAFCRAMYQNGFSLYSSWPFYRDGLSVDWVKKPWTSRAALDEQLQFLSQSRLSHIFGSKCFLTEPNPDLERSLWEAVTMLDGLIDDFDVDKSQQCRARLGDITRCFDGGKLLVDAVQAPQLLDCLTSVDLGLSLLESGDLGEIVDYCNTNEPFIRHWGSPGHYAVFCHSDFAARQQG